VRTRRLTLQYEDVDLSALSRAAVEKARAGLQEPELLRVEADAPVVGRWDRARLEQVLANLISNALKFGQGRPAVVSVVGTPSGAVLSVADAGLGIASEDQQRIFEQFERATPARNYGGLGLGLWLTRAIVVEHGGQITVQSAPGQGARFRVELPRGAKPQVTSGAA
jgi:signal transduction histidine kinase